MQDYRKLKVAEKHVRNKWNEKKVPELKLCGEWLRNAGFEPGDNCTIKVEKGRITILYI
jgi:hypothetical protein